MNAKTHGRSAFLAAIAHAIRTKLNPNPMDISGLTGGITKLLDASITGVDMPAKPAPVMNLSKIDFEAPAQAVRGIQAQEHGP